MSYLRNCILESLRLNNPLITTFRSLNKDFTFYGKDKNFETIHNTLLKKYFEKGTFIHKDSDESFILICKNQTCSEKLKSSEQVREYINAKSI